MNNLAEVQEFLPDSVHLLIEVIGINPALVIVEYYGGTYLDVPFEYKNNHILVKLIGPKLAHTLIQRCASERLDIPRCVEALRVLKGQIVYQEYQNGVNQSQLARKYKVSRRWINELCKREAHRQNLTTNQSQFDF